MWMTRAIFGPLTARYMLSHITVSNCLYECAAGVEAPVHDVSRATSTSSSNGSAAHSVNVIPILPATAAITATTATASASSVVTESIDSTAMVTSATANADAALEEPPKAVRNANLKIDVEASQSTDPPRVLPIARRPGCFPLCGWTSHKIKSPVRPAAVMKDDASTTDPSVKPKEKPATDTTQCVICCKASAFEAHLSKAFFCPGRVDGKSVKYAGLPVECYRTWFKERPMTPESVRKTHAKRTTMLTKLQRQHKLHYHKLKDVCNETCTAFSAATCFVSLADKDLELIVGNYGSMLHFSCIPREIGMCDYVMGSSEQRLLVSNAPEDPVFRENPMLRAAKAHFYFGVPIFVDGTGIGAIAVLDVRPRTDPPDPLAVAQMKQMAVMMGSRVSALLCGGSPSSFSSRMLKLLQE